eukprot:PLAT631.1.p1 GENE.PLAT631.1~~PLAT631.1.p1  ORF type:complete len:347 (-),score=139.33 PLAT631.1:40-1059(-)
MLAPPASAGGVEEAKHVEAEAAGDGVRAEKSPAAGKQLLTGHTRTITACCFAPGDSSLLTCSADGVAEVAPLFGGSTLQLEGHAQGLNDGAWAPHGAYIATASDDKQLRLWDSKSGACVRTLSGHSNYVFCTRFAATGSLLTSGSFDQTVKLWDVRARKCVRSLPAHGDAVIAVDVSPDGRTLLSASYDGLCRLWDIASGLCLRTLHRKCGSPVSFARFSPNGRYALISTLDGKLRLWDITALPVVVRTYCGCVNEEFTMPSHFVGGCPASVIVSGSEDGCLKLWDVHTRHLLLSHAVSSQALLAVAVDSCRKRLAVAASVGKRHAIRMVELQSLLQRP